MPLPTITEEDLKNVDLTRPLPIKNSPMAQEDPERAELIQHKMGNPVEVQQFTMTEFRVEMDRRIAADYAKDGKLSESTLKWMIEMNKQLSEIHDNIYGSKSTQVAVSGKLTHAQLASFIRSGQKADAVVDVTPKPEEEVVDERK